MQLFKKIVLKLDNIIERVANWGLVSSGIMILIMGFLSTYAVIRRYLFNNPEPYSYEISTILLTVCVVIAISGLQRAKRHLRVDFLANYFSPTVQVIFLDIIGPILGLIYVAVITWQSWKGMTYSFSVHETSQSVWREPLWPTKLVIPVSMFWLCLVLLSQLIRGCVNVARGVKAPPKEDSTTENPK
jgi:TRAP-type mannitol/chloroaromatic compound transport system permease small subunit